MAFPIVTVEGNIGSGKTSLSKKLAKDMGGNPGARDLCRQSFFAEIF